MEVQLDMDQMRQYAALDAEIKALDKKLKKLKADKEAMQDPLLTQMAAAGLQNFKLSTGETLYIREEVWPKMLEGVTRDDVIAAIQADGLGFVKPNYNAQTFGAYIRELNNADEPLPENLAKVVEPSSKFKLVVTH